MTVEILDIQKYNVVVSCCVVNDVDKAIRRILDYEGKGIWIQLIPSKLILSKRQLIFAISLAIDAWEKGFAISKKLNLEVLLRFLGKTQIRQAIGIFNKIQTTEYWVVIICDINKKIDMQQGASILMEICSSEIINCQCEPDIELILSVYNLDYEDAKNQAAFRSEEIYSTMDKMLLEKINIGLLD